MIATPAAEHPSAYPEVDPARRAADRRECARPFGKAQAAVVDRASRRCGRDDEGDLGEEEVTGGDRVVHLLAPSLDISGE
jgi:hypothetical protein